MVEDQGGGRRLYKARGADGEATWVDHQRLWRLQQSQAEEARRRQARRRGLLALGLAGFILVAVASAMIALRSERTVSLPTGLDGEAEAIPPVVAGAPASTINPSAADAGTDPLAVAAPTATSQPPAIVPPRGDGVADVVWAWAKAWAGQDVASYLAAYSEVFEPAEGLSLPAWRALRRERLLTPAFIDLEIEELEVTLPSQGRAEARFLQRYRSRDYADVVRKTLRLVEEGGEWRILAERAEEP